MATTPPRTRHQDSDTAVPDTPLSEKKRLKGLWDGEKWMCNCTPRQQAVECVVKRKTRNKGRKFWACPEFKCKLYLWFEEARLREVGLAPSAVAEEDVDEVPPSTQARTPSLTQRRLTACGFRVTNSRRQSDPGSPSLAAAAIQEVEEGDEVVALPRAPSSSQPEVRTTTAAEEEEEELEEEVVAESSVAAGKRPAVSNAPGGGALLTPGPSGSSKRKRDALDDDDDNDDEFSDFGTDDELQLAVMTDRSVQKFKRQQAYEAASADRVDDDFLNPTAQPIARTLFPRAGSPSKRQKTVAFEEPSLTQASSSQTANPRAAAASFSSLTTTQTLSADEPAAAAAASSSSSSSFQPPTVINNDDYSITNKVTALLVGQKVDHQVLQSVKTLLDTSALKARGIAMGRQQAIAAIKDRDITIARLQQQILGLQNKEGLLNSQITNMKASLMKMYDDN